MSKDVPRRGLIERSAKDMKQGSFIASLEDCSSGDDRMAHLQCPECGSCYLHQIATDIYEREEDAQFGKHTKVRRNETVVDTDMSGNPSARRQGLVITFECENCDALPQFAIYQHKGCTYLKLFQRIKAAGPVLQVVPTLVRRDYKEIGF